MRDMRRIGTFVENKHLNWFALRGEDVHVKIPVEFLRDI